MKLFLMFMLLLPKLVLANVSNQSIIVGDYVYLDGDSIIVRQDAIITQDGFYFIHNDELDKKIKGEQDGR